MGKNVLSPSDCRIFKSAISREQNNERAWFYACWYIFMEIKHWLKNIGMRVVKNGCGKSGHMTQKSTVSQERINGINWFLVCWWKFRKAWSYVNKFWMLVFKNGCGLLGLFGSLKSVSREWMNEWNELIFFMLIQI